MKIEKQVPLDQYRSIRMAKAIVILENYNVTGSLVETIHSPKVATKMRDHQPTISSGRRDALKFFSKRVSCSCLKERYQEARRTQPKMGLCYGCDEEIERVALSVCSRCMITQYCSRECQVANWPIHKVECDMCVHVKSILNDETDG